MASARPRGRRVLLDRHRPRSRSSVPFPNLTSEKKSAVVARWIWKQIDSGQYGVGKKLPPERELVKILSVSRFPIREAIGALVANGLLRAQPGDGTYVARTPRDLESGSVFDLIAQDDSPLEALELRLIVELGVVPLALDRGIEAQIPVMTRAVAVMKEAMRAGDRDAYIEADDTFHLALARATQNLVVEEHLAMLLRVRRSTLWRILKEAFLTSPEHYRKMLEIHERILRCAKRRDVRGARQAMTRHFDEIVQELERRSGA